MKKGTLITVLITAFALFSTTAFAANIAYVDVAEVFDNYQGTKDQDMRLKTEGEEKESQRNAIISDIKQLEDEMALLSKEARELKQEQIIEKKRQLEDFDREVRRELGEVRNKAVREIFEVIDGTIADYGKANGYDMILNKRVLVYQTEELDLTQAILDELQRNYQNS